MLAKHAIERSETSVSCRASFALQTFAAAYQSTPAWHVLRAFLPRYSHGVSAVCRDQLTALEKLQRTAMSTATALSSVSG